MMKSVIHDWDDEKTRPLLRNCRRAIPDDGVLLIVECELSEPNLASAGKLIDQSSWCERAERSAPSGNTASY